MDERELPFTEHLEELRTRVIRGCAAVAVLSVGTFIFKKELYGLLTEPLKRAFDIARQIDPTYPAEFVFKMSFKDPVEPFFTQLKVALLAAIFLAVPVLTYQVWKFVAPGLYSHEKRATFPFMFVAITMFAVGASFCYFAVMPFGYGYLLTYGGAEYEPAIMMQEYLKLTARLLIAFGLVFELPVFIVFMARVGIVDANQLRGFRKHAVVGTFILAAILTPPDIVTQVALALPLVLLYEFSIIGAQVFGQKRPNEVE